MPGADRFQQIVEHIGEFVWLVDAAFEDLLYINPASQRFVGRPVGGGHRGQPDVPDGPPGRL